MRIQRSLFCVYAVHLFLVPYRTQHACVQVGKCLLGFACKFFFCSVSPFSRIGLNLKCILNVHTLFARLNFDGSVHFNGCFTHSSMVGTVCLYSAMTTGVGEECCSAPPEQNRKSPSISSVCRLMLSSISPAFSSINPSHSHSPGQTLLRLPLQLIMPQIVRLNGCKKMSNKLNLNSIAGMCVLFCYGRREMCASFRFIHSGENIKKGFDE